MPNGRTDVLAIRKAKPEVLIGAAALGIGGIVLIVMATRKQGPSIPTNPLGPGESLGDLTSPTFSGQVALPITLARGANLAALRPTVVYQGPGRDTFSYFRVMQVQGGVWTTVYGSGVAGVHVGPASTPTRYDLVSPDEIQPTGCPSQSLCALIYPGPLTTPICGAPPQAGPATAVLEIYELKFPADADGFSAPTCVHEGALRKPVQGGVRIWTDAIRFV